jgi:tetratricopeptide (TPR) repeat protein
VFPATLLADYNQGAFALSKGWSDPWTLGPLALLLALAAAALACLKRAPRVSFGLGWFALTLAPVAQIVPYHELGADHYVYLPSIGLLMIAGTGFALLWDRLGRGPALGALVAVLAAFVVRTEVRILDWRSAEALFRATLATAPNSARASLNIGVQIASRPARDGTGQSVHILEALPYFDRAIEIDPEYIYAYLTRAKAYRHLGREVEAVASLERALELARRADDPPVESDEILILLRRFAEARVLLQVKCANPRAKPNVIYRLGICRAALGDRRGALECLIRIVEGGRYGTKVAVEGMQAAASLGDHARAAWFFERLEAINPETARQIAEATARARELSAAAASRPPTATAAPVERRLDE